MAKNQGTEITLKQKRVTLDTRKYMMIFALLGIWVLFTILSKGTYIMPRNMSNLFRQSVFTGILAIGALNVIVLGHVDLSVGSLAGLCGGTLAIFNVWNHFDPVVSILIAITLGILLGLWNGWWVAYRNVPSFIVTLAGLLVFRGVLVGITDGITIGPVSPFFALVGKEFIDSTIGIILAVCAVLVFTFTQIIGWKQKKAHGIKARMPWVQCLVFAVLVIGFALLMNGYHGIPNPVILLLILFIIFNYVTNRTVFGRRIYAIGGNRIAARLAGINIKAITLVVFAINGLMAAIAGIFLAARLDSASVNAATSAELDAIAACVIGGTSMAGGIGTVFGAIVGAVVMSSLDNGMSLLDAPSFYQTIVKGIVLLLAVWFDMSRKKESKE